MLPGNSLFMAGVFGCEANPGVSNIPMTMAAYGMRGTPSLILIDAKGNLQANYFGQISELRIGAEIATLISEGDVENSKYLSSEVKHANCDDHGCGVPVNT